MLKNLYIENYALIEKLKVDFRPGFTIITGETGAGKSILLGALSLILGKRADTAVLKDKTKKCIVEGEFDISNYNLRSFFKTNEIDYDPVTILRREIALNGKSRSFINDTPVTLNILGEIGIKLVDIHSQHENLNLNNSEFQLNVVDHFARLFELRNTYQQYYSEYQHLKQQFAELEADSLQSKKDLDYWQFQWNELNEAKLLPDEQEELEEELKQLNHAEEIKTQLSLASSVLSGEEQSVIPVLKTAVLAVQRVNKYLSKSVEIFERLDSVSIELKDIARELESLDESIQMDPQRLEFVSDRLNTIYTLQQKHNAGNIHELIQIKNELEEKIDNIINFDSNLEKLKNRLNESKEKVNLLAGELSEKRTSGFAAIEKIIEQLLKDLGMPNARFAIDNKIQEIPGVYGKDHIQFLFTANKNVSLQEISKVASGGELSRLMLSIKTLLSDSTGLPTIILDEIDAGVSGEVADKVGNIIKKMATRMQVFNITHLPQVASKGDYHYLVYKADNKSSTHTFIKELNSDERQLEIAKMLSGEQLTNAAVENAKELLKSQ
ncbi:MAG: DNA repair protein RecN [Bacteroidales bacterium]|nr:DNA repair protein RecN [Bacteroidales bacterium]